MQQNTSNADFKEKIKELFQMNLLITSSALTKNLLKGLNLTPAEFLRPFGVISHDKKIKIRTINGREKLIPDFTLNFLDYEEYQQTSKAKIEECLKETIVTNFPDINKNLNTNFTLQEEAEKHLIDNKTIWFEKCTDLIFDFTKFSHDLNYIDQPWAIIYMISSDELDCLNELSKLVSETTKMINQNFMVNSFDVSTIPKLVFILFDTFKSKPDDALARTNEIRIQYPNFYLKLFSLNSKEDDYVDLWSNLITRKYEIKININPENLRLGCCLSERDKDNIYDTFIEIILKIIVPYIENRIAILDASITLNKKGLKNTMKSFFKKNEKIENPNSYQMNFSESATRNLADILFLIQDYDQALQIYKLSTTDFKNKSNKHHANALEMLIYSSILSETPLNKKEIEQLFENYEMAFNLYATSQENLRFAARILVFELMSFKIYNKYSKDSIKFIYDSSHYFKEYIPALYPLFLEQYALLNLKLKPIQYRKYCLNLLFAGNKYNQLTFKKNALRCILITNGFYTDTKWHIINEYSYLQLARFFSDIKDYFQSLKYQKFALNEARSQDSIDKHNNIINELGKIMKNLENDKKNNIFTEETFLKILNDSGKTFLPRVNVDSIDIAVESDKYFIKNERKLDFSELYCKIKKKNFESDDPTWLDLSELINSRNKDAQNQLNMTNHMREKNIMRLYDSFSLEEKNQLFNRKERFCYVDEPIYVVCYFDNPLKISLELKNIRLLYEFESNDIMGNVSELVNVSIEKMTLNALSNQNQCILKIVPFSTGKLKLIGIEWIVFKINTQYIFNFKGKKN